MRCRMRDCTKAKDVNPTNGLCPGCAKTVFGSQPDKRQENSVRQNSARAQAQDQHRDLNISLSPTPSSSSGIPLPGAPPSGAPPSMAPPANNLINFPNIGSQRSTSSSAPPTMDIPILQQSYQQMLSGGSQQPQGQILTDMYGMLLNVLSKQTENDGVKHEVKENSDSIRELEAKVGGPEEISEKLGIYIRNLPMPAPGISELDNARAAISEVKAPGVDVGRDVTKASRFGLKDEYLGTVKVEILNDESRASIMKTKKFLANHTNPTMKNLIIGNLKTGEQMRMENFARDLLKMLPDGNNYYVAGNGHLRRKDLSQQGHQQHFRPPPPQGPQPYQPRGPRNPAPQPPRHHQHEAYQAPHEHVPHHVRVPAPAQPRPQPTYQQPASQYAYQFPPNILNQPPYSQNPYPQYHIRIPAPTPTHAQAPNPLDQFDLFQTFAAPPAPVNAHHDQGARGVVHQPQQVVSDSEHQQGAVQDRNIQASQ